MRKFEKISFNRFKKDIKDDEELYNSYEVPVRKTKLSAGYDFELIEDLTLKAGEWKKIPLGIKVAMEDDEFLQIIIRSSMGFKYNVRMTNQVGIVDADYYNNESNEGHLYLSLQNHGENDFELKKSEGICQGIFMKYLKVENDSVEEIRVGGYGSTTKGGDKHE
jgi:dUTPase